ncbi:hypothetical protein AOQ84DRAFT_94252 [Glonium stellatum]|uniref:Zn(2)-C6 fungal-type domain-containing protein n=1 Tax=Glonium stellatum TaxID=574774 RepID=A0A8E2EWJ0_9PEZI|nr:hypothetical protein AOQ84DRAFT_94252 [Glonium stellatum]
MLPASHPAPDIPAQPSQPPPASTTRKKPRKPRGRGLRTTTGCAVCRRRHMKCDEAKPTCGPCAKGGRQCIYNSASKVLFNMLIYRRYADQGTYPIWLLQSFKHHN